MNFFRKTALLAILVFSANASMADPITVTVDTGSTYADLDVTSCTFYCRAGTALADSLTGLSFQLGDNDSYTFDFFSITVGGLGAGTASIEASLAFLLPEIFSATGTGDGGFGSILGFISGGYLHWEELDSFTLEDGSMLFMSFEEILTGGLGNTTMVSMTMTRVSETAVSVPEPGTLALLGIGLLGMGLAGRRRKI